jgi:hypothetical protein
VYISYIVTFTEAAKKCIDYIVTVTEAEQKVSVTSLHPKTFQNKSHGNE